MSKIQLGDVVKDTVTGFRGMAVARCVYLNGCIQFLVKAQKLDKDGKRIEGEWIDEGQLKLVKKGPRQTGKARPGGGVRSHPTI